MNTNQILEHNKEMQTKGKASGAAEVAKYLKELQNYENDQLSELKGQRKKAMIFGMAGWGLAFLTVIGILSMLPLKTVVPYVIRVNNVTGETDIVNPLSKGKETFDSKLTKFWISQYIEYRESYSWQLTKFNSSAVELMSTDKTFNQYQAKLLGVNSPLQVFKKSKNVVIENKGTVFIGEKSDIAQTRFTKTVVDTNGIPDPRYPVTNWVAITTWDYNKEIKRKWEERINPLGFQVTSFKVTPVSSEN